MKQIIKNVLNQQLLISLLILNAVIFILFSPNHYFFELFLSIAFQIILGIVFMALLFLLYKKWIGLSVSLIAILLIYTNISYLRISDSKHVKIQNVDLKIAHFNVLKFNTNFQQTIDAINLADADIVSINEMTFDWENALDTSLKEKYPYKYLVARNNSFGIGIFSKTKLFSCETIWFQGIPYISGKFEINNKTIQFLCVHTIPPTSKYAFAIRNNEIKNITNYLKINNIPKVVIGDFNAVSWSPTIKNFRANLHLKDSRKTFSPSYPAWNKLLMIPIDHIFYTKEIKCLSFNTISNTSSDHYGIVGEYRL